MKITEMIKNLQDFMEEHGDLDCWYAVDDEGNEYHEVYYDPSCYYANKYGEVFQEEDLEYEDDEDIAELKKICVIN